MKELLKSSHFIIYRCSVCGNIMVKLSDSGLTPQCCGRDMYELKPGEKDGAHEFHIPVCDCDGKKLVVNIGEKPHPMTDNHHIEWILLKTSLGFYVRFLDSNASPDTCFKLCHDEQAVAIYAYCNMHGLWIKDLT